jgi:hypothetical protein
MARLALDGQADAVLAELRKEGFVRPNISVDAQATLDYLQPILAPIADDHFRFSRDWMRREAARIADPRSEANKLARQLNLPPAYLMIHRVTIGSIGVLSQLGAEGNFRQILERWMPGFGG